MQGGHGRGHHGLLLGRARRASCFPWAGRPRTPVSVHPGLLSGITEDKGHLFPPESTGLTDHLWSHLHCQTGQGWSSRAQLLSGTCETLGLNFSIQEQQQQHPPHETSQASRKRPLSWQCLVHGVDTKGVWSWG